MPFWRCVGGITTEDFIGRLKQIQGRVEAGGVVLTGLTGTTDQWGTTPEMLRGPGPTEGLSALIWLTV